MQFVHIKVSELMTTLNLESLEEFNNSRELDPRFRWNSQKELTYTHSTGRRKSQKSSKTSEEISHIYRNTNKPYSKEQEQRLK